MVGGRKHVKVVCISTCYYITVILACTLKCLWFRTNLKAAHGCWSNSLQFSLPCCPCQVVSPPTLILGRRLWLRSSRWTTQRTSRSIMEVFSLPPVAFACRRKQLVAVHSIDLLSGYDLTQFDSLARALRLIDAYKPKFIIVSPPCTDAQCIHS